LERPDVSIRKRQSKEIGLEIKSLKKHTKQWYTAKMERNSEKLRDLEAGINNLILLLMGDSSNIEEGNILQQKELERNNILMGTEEKWILRSRAIWLSSEENNINFFQNFANYNRGRKHVWEINDDNENIIIEKGSIKEATINHFKYFYKAQDSINTVEQVKIMRFYLTMLKDEETIKLFQPVSMEELKQVLFKFKKEKSPGLDGWTFEFFTYFFDIFGQDPLDMVEEMRRLGSMVGILNSTFLTLIPKANKPKTFDDFFPISLCNLCYKVI